MVKVLIVDDSLLAEHALKSYFEKLGHHVVGLARSGEIGEEMFEELEPDLVTVDAVMPGMSGQDFVKLINNHDKENQSNTKIIMITGDEVSEEDKSMIEVDEYILKPVTLSKIEEVLDSIL